MVFGLLKNEDSKNGFFWTDYAPVFYEMKEKNQVETFARILKADLDKDAEAKKWLESNPEKVTAFNQWLQEYK